MSLSQCKYTTLREAVQPESESSIPALPVRLLALAAELEHRTRRSVRRCFSNHQRIVQDARILAGVAEFAGWLLQSQSAQIKTQSSEITRLKLEIKRLEDEADDLFWGPQIVAHEAKEDGRFFMETCAAEHSFRDILA